jgi:hypothetical protein
MGLILRVGIYFLILWLLLPMKVLGFQIPDSTLRLKVLPSDTISSFQQDSIIIETIFDTLYVSQFIPLLNFESDLVVADSLIVSSRPKLVSSDSIPRDTVKYWRTGGALTLNLSQIALSNWSSGGQNSVAANMLVSLTANYSNSAVAWDNSIDFGFGRQKRENTPAVKTDDRLDILTKYGRRISKNLFYSTLLNFKTQLFPGYEYPEKDSIKKSDFLSPATVFLSVGIDYKPNANFSFMLSGVTGKTTIVKSKLLSSREFFGVDSGRHFRHEFGGYMKLLAKGNIFKLANYQFKLDAFSNYMEKPENIDWDCELTLGARLNKYITANLKVNLLYDDNIVTPPNHGPRLQFRQFLGVGFSYRF